MREVADNRNEPALWEPWARAATNIVADLGVRDPQPARALLDDMREIADNKIRPPYGHNGRRRRLTTSLPFAPAMWAISRPGRSCSGT